MNAPHSEAAEAFLQFMQTPAAHMVYTGYGFRIPTQ